MTEENNLQQKENQSQKPLVKEKNTGMAIVAYIIFFIPFLTEAKNDPFVKFHIKQGLALFISEIIVGIISYILPWQFWMVSRLLNLGLFALMIFGIVNASKGDRKPLPVIGKFEEQFKF